MSCSGSTEMLHELHVRVPRACAWRPFITLVIRGHESGQRVKMNEATQTRSARSASVTARPERSVSRNVAERERAGSPRSWPRGGGRGPTRTQAVSREAEDRADDDHGPRR